MQELGDVAQAQVEFERWLEQPLAERTKREYARTFASSWTGSPARSTGMPIRRPIAWRAITPRGTSDARRIGAQLNKSETLHALHRHIAFDQRQQLPADEDDQRRHALSRELVSNAILAWNTRYLTAVIDELRATDHGLVSDEALAQLSPVGHAHVNPNGRYRSDAAGTPAEGRPRPLRAPAQSEEETSRPTQAMPVNGDKQ